ncbi:transmembrane protein [Arcticibacter svalbardensis MN12-7]|uniref:Transmembrane protein n=1 Tax=Arcticibacter svalbardensis MN12-7 TaxID=1150600 RepID=R9GNX1_9SPHI|nr:SCO family protein [Arcticibacter svalbardensis]EOR93423.1 transmembrane protein [Arcticibacter svalbardensis MN12-7]
MMPFSDTMPAPEHFNKDTPEEEIAEFVNTIQKFPNRRKLLVDLLSERHPLYQDRGANQVIRIRGYILANFETVGLPKSAILYVLQELENGIDVYTVAAAAKALRGMDPPSKQLVPFLLKAIRNIRDMDDAVTFEMYKPDGSMVNYTTALKELFLTLSWLGAYAQDAVASLEQMSLGTEFYASTELKSEIEQTIQCIRGDVREINSSCCSISFDMDVNSKSSGSNIRKVVLEDQNKESFRFNQFFKGTPTLVAFFYTRCNNPNKCSATITRLVQLRRTLEADGIQKLVKTVAITYDPEYDIASRLKVYGENRRFVFDINNRFLRADPDSYTALRKYFSLGVNYSGSIVNQHRIELYLLDQHGKVIRSFTHLKWEENEVLDAVKNAISNATKPVLFQYYRNFIIKTFGDFLSVIPSLIVAFFPKCPICWAVYLSMFGVAGLNTIPYSPWLLPVFCGVMGINLFTLFLNAKRRNGLLPFYISVVGALFILFLGLIFKIKLALYLGVSLVFIGALLNSLSFRLYSTIVGKLKFGFRL